MGKTRWKLLSGKKGLLGSLAWKGRCRPDRMVFTGMLCPFVLCYQGFGWSSVRHSVAVDSGIELWEDPVRLRQGQWEGTSGHYSPR